MPWTTRNTMDLRREFVALASQEDINRRELCRRFGISAKTGYKWLARFGQHGEASLADRSRHLHCSPKRAVPSAEDRVLTLREQHPAWRGRKIAARLDGRRTGAEQGDRHPATAWRAVYPRARTCTTGVATLRARRA